MDTSDRYTIYMAGRLFASWLTAEQANDWKLWLQHRHPGKRITIVPMGPATSTGIAYV